VRDDAKKWLPCLIAYADLPGPEKHDDRQAAMETLKAIWPWVWGAAGIFTF